jgi:hypothetical protein
LDLCVKSVLRTAFKQTLVSHEFQSPFEEYTKGQSFIFPEFVSSPKVQPPTPGYLNSWPESVKDTLCFITLNLRMANLICGVFAIIFAVASAGGPEIVSHLIRKNNALF